MRKGMLGWFEHVVRIADKRIMKQTYNTHVERLRYRRRPELPYHDRLIGRCPKESRDFATGVFV